MTKSGEKHFADTIDLFIKIISYAFQIKNMSSGHNSER